VIGDRRAELLGLRARDRLQGRLVLLDIPDFQVVARLGGRTGAQDDAVEDRFPQQPLILDHARVGQEFLEVNPHAVGVGGIGRAEIDQEHADTFRPGFRRSGASNGNDHGHVGAFARCTILVKTTGGSLLSHPLRVGGTMTVAEWCVFGTLMLSLLTIASVKWISFRRFDNSKPRDPAFYEDPIRARALGAHQNGIEAFPFFAVAVLLAEFRLGPLRLIDELAVLFLIVRIAYVFTYLGNRPTLRSILWSVGFAINVAIFFLPAIKGYLPV
jgi:uncharacterized MAPEG superfamily protein